MHLVTDSPYKRGVFKKFELHDLIPYAIALFMLMGSIYFVLHFTEARL